MLKNLTQTFKDNCNAREVRLSEYVVLDNIQIPIKAELNDDCYHDGNFIGTFIFKELRFETSNEYDFRKKEFEYYKMVGGESVKIGTFITTEITDNDTEETIKVVAMDYGLKTQVEYTSQLNYGAGNVTLLDVWNENCEMSGLESGITSFTNSGFIVDSDQFSGTGATRRDVFIAIAQSSCDFVKVANDDKIYLVLKEETNEVIEEYTDLEDKRDTHAINAVRLGLSNIDGNDATRIKDGVEPENANWLEINDNPFAYTIEKREQLIDNIFNKIKDFGYSSFKTETSFKPYLTCGDLMKFKRKDGVLVNTILLRYKHNFDEITLEAPSIIKASVNYIRPKNEMDFIKRVEIKVDRNTNEIEMVSSQTQNVQDNLNNNYYTINQTNQLIQNAETGVTNTFSEAGGNNVFRNTGLWFESNDTDNPYEFWLGKAKSGNNDNATNYKTILLQNGSFIQEQEVPNGNYSISFWYKKLISQSVASVVINDKEYQLDSTDYKQFYTGEKDSETNEYITEPIVVTSGHIKIEFKCDADNGVEVYDLMCNKGSVKLAYSQNQNETTTDTVNISKGITITSSNDENVKFKADYDGIRTLNKNGDVKTRFTDKGMETDEAIIRYKEQTCGTLIQEVGDQTWFTRM